MYWLSKLYLKGLSGIPPESQTETGSLKLQSRRYRYLLRILNVVSLLLRLEGLKNCSLVVTGTSSDILPCINVVSFHFALKRILKTAVSSSLQVPPPNTERRLSSVEVRGSLKLQSRRYRYLFRYLTVY